MLEPVPMVRLEAVVLRRDERAALLALGGLGQVHLVRGQGEPGAALQPPAADAPSPWEDLLERAERLRRRLGALSPPGLAAVPWEGPPEALDRALGAAEERVRELAARREEQLRRRDARSHRADHLRCYAGLPVPLSRIGASPWLVLRVGTALAPALEELQAAAAGRALVLPLPAQPGEERRALLALAPGRVGSDLGRLLERAGFQDEPLAAERSGTLDALAGAAREEADVAGREVARLDAELRALGEALAPELAAMEQRIRLEQRLREAGGCFPRTGTAVVVQGWLPAARSPEVEGALRAATGGRCALETTPPRRDEEDEVPVLLRSSPLLRPFERLVAGFGLPRYLELSPTPFLAVSYLLMFGMMFGDVGHGAVLSAAGLAALRSRRWRDAGRLLLCCGISSCLLGAVYGSCFGLERFRALALWRDPLGGAPDGFLLAGMGVGVATISLGLLLNVVNRWRRRDLVGALLDRFGVAGLVFYWSALALVLLRGRAAVGGVLAALLVAGACGWVLEERVRAGVARRRRVVAGAAPGAGLTRALVEALETGLLYLANTISFVRLAAYSMSHAALLLAVAMLAQALARPGGEAGPVSWVVLAVGNAVVILLEGVVASVQALRLEYYEFFGKFFSGAGRPFAPFRLELAGGLR